MTDQLVVLMLLYSTIFTELDQPHSIASVNAEEVHISKHFMLRQCNSGC